MIKYRVTDYDYFLVHLFEENEDYYKKALECVAKGRETILDNSIFELEEAFDAGKFAGWVNRMKPTYYIVPDVLEDQKGTLGKYNEFVHNYPNLPGKAIAVVQGKTYEEVVRLYRYFEQEWKLGRIGKIAISFDYSFYKDIVPQDDLPTKYHYYTVGRQQMLYKMLKDGVINSEIPHHLLGCGLPQEFAFYRHFKWIDSIDTSNPVIHGLFGEKYERLDLFDIYGLEDKKSQKLFELINSDVSDKQMNDIHYNIERFRYNTYS